MTPGLALAWFTGSDTFSDSGVTVSDVAAQMKADGYNATIIDNLIATGVTVDQLKNLYDNYNPRDFLQPAAKLQQQLADQNAPGAGAVLDTLGSAASSIKNAVTPSTASQKSSTLTILLIIGGALTVLLIVLLLFRKR